MATPATSLVKTKTRTIDEGNGRHFQFLRARHQIFRTRSSLEKTECGRRMQLDVFQS